MSPRRRSAFVVLEGAEIDLFDRMREHLGHQSDANLLRSALFVLAQHGNFHPGPAHFEIRHERSKRRGHALPRPTKRARVYAHPKRPAANHPWRGQEPPNGR